MEELESKAAAVTRRILPDEPVESRLFHDLQALTAVLLREIDSQKNTLSGKDDSDCPAASYTEWLSSGFNQLPEAAGHHGR